MGEFINKHSLKIQVGVLLSFLVFVVTIALYVGGFVKEVEAHESKLKEYSGLVNKIPILESNVSTIKDDIKEIKSDIKSLLKIR